ncbi:MAG: hypothetical protein WCT01_02135 [Candidatus Shapirobacteria bacterium]
MLLTITKINRTGVKVFLATAAAIGALITLTLSIICGGVGEMCKKVDNGDCVVGLISKVEDSSLSFGERNRAIWALGQLADKRALPTLNKYFKGVPLRRELPERELSQYELEKAIKWCTEGNVTSWMYFKYR